MNKQNKSTNTLSVQCPERGHSATSLKRQAKASTADRQETHTQTYDSFFVERPILKHQSTSTDINSDNFLNPKRRSVSSETTINNLNKNVCFLDGQFDHSDHLDYLSGELSASHQKILQVMQLGNQSTHPGTHQSNQIINRTPNAPISQANGQNVYETNHQDPLLSTISVQTDLDYFDDELAMNSTNCVDHLKGDHLENLLEFSDIQTQTYWNSNDNFTQTDFSLFDMENIF